jgi:hypothetical protein
VARGKPKGAQKGHSDQQRPLLPPDQVDDLIVCHPQQCPDCATALPPDLPDAQPPIRTQVWELPLLRAQVTTRESIGNMSFMRLSTRLKSSTSFGQGLSGKRFRFGSQCSEINWLHLRALIAELGCQLSRGR